LDGGDLHQQRQANKSQEKTIILFVCVDNAGRSQMAEGFFNTKYTPKGYRAISAGTSPASQINPLAIQVMKEVGLILASKNQKY
jgi:arsenate reductase (thioredoxin)